MLVGLMTLPAAADNTGKVYVISKEMGTNNLSFTANPL
jgi:hypothetical protein